jgi:3-phosphoshikimate 1-carboxyvinyltransferase
MSASANASSASPKSPLWVPPVTSVQQLTWRVPGSKSITNRAFPLAALAEGTSVIENVLVSDDTRHMRQALTDLGITMRDGAPGQVVIDGGRSRLRACTKPLFIGNSGTTVRFLSALAALIPGITTFVGDEHMAKRPIADLVDGLRQLGIYIDCPTGCPPITITGGALTNDILHMRGDRSSQYFSAVLMSLGLLGRPITVRIDGELVSRPYVDMTRRMVADFGGRIDAPDEHTFIIRQVPSYRARTYHITVPNLSQSSLQGDFAFTRVLEQLGAQIEYRSDATVITGTNHLHGIDVDMHHISDTVMTLAAIAPLLHGPTTIRNIANIRIKETDRLIATVNELRRLGQHIEHGDDWLSIHPRPLRPAEIQCYSDHRMAMSFAILAATARDHHWDASVPAAQRKIIITDPACTGKTYPTFWQDLARCYPAAEKPWE